MGTATERPTVPDSHHEEVEGLLGWLDGPRLVVGGFAFFVLGLTVLGILLWSDQRQQQRALIIQVERINQIQKERREQAIAGNVASVDRCYSSATQGPRLRVALRALETETMDPEAKAALRSLRRVNEANTPTIRECRQLADELEVKPPKERR